MSLLTVLQSFAAPVIAATGLPPEAIIIYAQQDVQSAIDDTLARHNAAVLLGITTASGSNPHNAHGPITATLEVIVWTPEFALTDNAPQTFLLLDAIAAALHGYTPAASRPTPNHCPAFRRYSLSIDTKDDTRYLTGTALFDLQHVPSPLP